MLPSSKATVHPEMHTITDTPPENADTIPVKPSTEHVIVPHMTVTWKVVFYIVAANFVLSVAICTILILVLTPTCCPLNAMDTTNYSEHDAQVLRAGLALLNNSLQTSSASIAHSLNLLDVNQRSVNDTVRSLMNDVDECVRSTHNCHPNAVCSNTVGSFSCTCGPGYSGNGFNCTWASALVDIKANGRHTCASNMERDKCFEART